MFLKGTEIIGTRHVAFLRANPIPGLSSKNVDEWMFNMIPQWALTHIKCLQPASGKCWTAANSLCVSLTRSWSVGGSCFNHWKASQPCRQVGKSCPACRRSRKARHPKLSVPSGATGQHPLHRSEPDRCPAPAQLSAGAPHLLADKNPQPLK